jgi:hypothetical protein
VLTADEGIVKLFKQLSIAIITINSSIIGIVLPMKSVEERRLVAES